MTILYLCIILNVSQKLITYKSRTFKKYKINTAFVFYCIMFLKLLQRLESNDIYFWVVVK